MSTLEDRLNEVMAAMRWGRGDLVRVSQQSSSVVSQWLGKSTKPIKTIGKLEAAIRIERASGYAALWIAKGIGPKRAALERFAQSNEPAGRYGPPSISVDAALAALSHRLGTVDDGTREALAVNFAGWARSGGAEPWSQTLALLLGEPPAKRNQKIL